MSKRKAKRELRKAEPEFGFGAEPFRLVGEKAPSTEFTVPVSVAEQRAIEDARYDGDLFAGVMKKEGR